MRSWLLLLVAALVAIAATGCGGRDVDKVLEQTFSGSAGVRSGRLNLRLVVDAKGVPGQRGPLTIAVTGPFQSQPAGPPKFDLDVRLASNGATVTAGAVSTGDRGFIKLQGSSYAVPDSVFAGFRQGFERVRAQRAPTARNPSLASLGIDPRKWMKDPRDEGEGVVAGQATTHVSSGIDVRRLLSDLVGLLERASRLGVASNRRLPTMLSGRQRAAVSEAIEEPSFDVFSGRDDHILRKIRMAFAFKVPEERRLRANGLRSGKVRFEVELGGVNQPQAVRAPANPRPFTELGGALSAVAALGPLITPGARSESGGGATLGPGQSSPSKTPASAQAYAQCVTAAGGDLAKAQVCSKLLPSR